MFIYIIVAIKSHLLFYFVIIMTILPDSWDQKESIVSTTPKSVTYHMYTIYPIITKGS